MPMQVEQHLDMVASTLKDLGRFKVTDLAGDQTQYPAFRRLAPKSKRKLASGLAIQWNLVMGTGGESKATKLFEADTYTMSDQLKTATVPWRHTKTSMICEEREIAMNSGESQIVPYVKLKRASALASYIKDFENWFWGLVATSDDVNPYGVKNFVTTTGLTSTFGINGTNPSGWSSVAGIDASQTANAAWRNGGATYVTMDASDGVPKLWEAITKTDFEPLLDMATYYNSKNEKCIFTNWNGLKDCKTFAMSNNDRLGFDMDPVGTVTLGRRPIQYIPILDADTTNPFYGLDFGALGIRQLADEWMKQKGPRMHSGQHRSIVTDWDSTWNLTCEDRRRQWLLVKAS